MKRVVIRVVALTVVVVGGLGAITQAQRVLRARGPGETPPTAEAIEAAKLAAAATSAAAGGAVDPNPLAQGGESPAARSPQADQYGNWSSTPATSDSQAAPAFTERPLSDADAEPAALTRGQSLEDPATGRVRPVRYDEPVELEPIPDEAAQADPQEPTLAEGVEEPVAAPGSQYEDVSPETAEPAADEPAEALPEEPINPGAPPQQVNTSRRRNGRALAEPTRLNDRAVAAPPLRPIDEPATDESPDNFRRPAATVPADEPQSIEQSIEGSGRPGDTQLEGRQSHALELEKQFPSDAQVGKPVAIDIKVRNAGSAPARSLEIVDAVPQGTRLIATRPQAEMGPQGAVRWAIAALKPGEEATVTMEVLPMVEGELGSVATVRYAAEASARAVVTRPVVALTVSGPKQVTIGEEVPYNVKVANNGSGIARGVLLSEQIPEGLSHPAGSELEYEVGDLRPGEAREVQLTLKAEKAGNYVNAILARGEGEAQAEDRAELEVIAPSLALDLAGGTRRYLERPAKFTLSVANNGTAPAKSLEISAELPRGLEFVEATHYGQYDAQAHIIRWSLDELPAGQVGSVELSVRPIAEGEQKIMLRGSGQPLASVEKEQMITVEGIATTMFEVVDVEDPIEENGETSYEIRVVNQGTKGATNVQVVAVLPDGLEAVSAEGPTRYQIDGQRVLFDPVERLAPKADTSYRVRVKATRSGEMRVQVQLLTDEMRSPVTEEESTRVYSNE